MANWHTMKTRITASVRTTNRMNALLSESLLLKRKTSQKIAGGDGDNEGENGVEKPKRDWQYFHINFNMERALKIIQIAIEDRLTWDRFSRSYDSWRALQLAETLAADIRDRIKRLNHKRHRIVCLLSIIERQNQGVNLSMRQLMDEKRDNFTNYVHERPTYFIVVTLFLVHKD